MDIKVKRYNNYANRLQNSWNFQQHICFLLNPRQNDIAYYLISLSLLNSMSRTRVLLEQSRLITTSRELLSAECLLYTICTRLAFVNTMMVMVIESIHQNTI
ncbi:Hypothetical_protein [Hexamita inflata]|uniref:Hypothetical_protein n=1 Tax=Hexamita inflata TaxID=28002 RepID=A0AA86PCV0_9EUKA|nr:Hypothetical protein HINF_LOCUS24140 [Hexamita inflata]